MPICNTSIVYYKELIAIRAQNGNIKRGMKQATLKLQINSTRTASIYCTDYGLVSIKILLSLSFIWLKLTHLILTPLKLGVNSKDLA